MNNFEYKADYEYFLNKLAHGDAELFESKFLRLFDFRDPKIKRAEFNKNRNKFLDILVKKYGLVCQLKLHGDCSLIKEFSVDHYIPLSTNKLNHELRHLKAEKGKKVVAQSFGSNDIENLRIACARCNSFKKHRIIL